MMSRGLYWFSPAFSLLLRQSQRDALRVLLQQALLIYKCLRSRGVSGR